MVRVFLFLSCAICLPASASANAAASNPFKSWVSLSKYMRASGIEPSRVSWPAVEQLCAPLMEYGQVPYNRCKYEKAQASYRHDIDQRECNVVAKAGSPSRSYQFVSYRPRSVVVRKNHRAGWPSKRQRRADVVGCMKNLGWASAYDWRLGAR